jgi:hypothetical protein
MGFSLLRVVTNGTVRSYRTFSPLPVRDAPSAVLLSAPLSVVLPRPAVSWHCALCSPDFPPRVATRRLSVLPARPIIQGFVGFRQPEKRGKARTAKSLRRP